MTEYKGNSYKYKSSLDNSQKEEKKIEKVVKGKVTTKKKSAFKNFVDMLFVEDFSTIKSYIFNDMIIPQVKDIFLESIDILLNGESGRRNKSSRASYQKYYDSGKKNKGYSSSSRNGYEEIILDSRGEAEDVLSNMLEIIGHFDEVTVSDLCELVGKDPEHTDNKWGWRDLSSASTLRVSEGYLLKLPKPIYLD